MRRLLVVVAACVLLAGCKVDTTLTIDVHDDGGGSVRVRVAPDPEVVARLTGRRVDVGQIGQRLAQQINKAFRRRIRFVFPGGQVTQVEPKPGKKVSLATTTTQFDTTRALLLGGAVVLGALGVVVFVRGEVRRRRQRRRGRPPA